MVMTNRSKRAKTIEQYSVDGDEIETIIIKYFQNKLGIPESSEITKINVHWDCSDFYVRGVKVTITTEEEIE